MKEGRKKRSIGGRAACAKEAMLRVCRRGNDPIGVTCATWRDRSQMRFGEVNTICVQTVCERQVSCDQKQKIALPRELQESFTEACALAVVAAGFSAGAAATGFSAK